MADRGWKNVPEAVKGPKRNKATKTVRPADTVAPQPSPYAPRQVHGQTHSIVGYGNTRALWEVILCRKIRKRYPQVNVGCYAEPTDPDANGAPRFKFVFDIHGPGSEEAIGKVRNHKLVKYLFRIDQVLPAYYAQRCANAPETILCCIHVRPKDTGSEVTVSTVTFDGDDMPVADNALIGTARNLLTAPDEHQEFGRKADRHADPFAEEAFPGDSRHRDEDERVVGRSGHRSREPIQLDSELLELRAVDQMPPDRAREYLQNLVLEKAKHGAEKDFLSWLMFLYEVESHFVLAELAESELSCVPVKLSPHVYRTAVIKIDLRSGIRPFTERRPSVMIEDDIILRRVGSQGNTETYRLSISNVTANEIWFHTTNQKPFEQKKDQPRLEEGEGQRRAEKLEFSIRQNLLFDVTFDSQPYRIRCKMLCRALGSGSNTYSFLKADRDPGLYDPVIRNKIAAIEAGMEEDEGVSTAATTATSTSATQGRGRGRGRGAAARTSRGGRFQGAEAVVDDEPPEVQRTSFDALGACQKLACNLITHSDRNIRKIFIEGPCGTGKTQTICQAVVQLLTNPNSRILMMTPSNSAADVLAIRLLELLGSVKRSDKVLIRVFNRNRHPLRCPEVVFPYTNFPRHIPFSQVTSDDRFEMEMLQDMKHRVVITTINCVNAMLKYNNSAFSHVFVDEVAQASIAETLMGLNVIFDKFSSTGCRFIFSGDSKQLGPKSHAKCCQQWLNQSICSSLKQSCNVIHLDESYRQTPQLAEVQSYLFYNGELKVAKRDRETPSLQPLVWSGLHGNPHPIRFIHTGGEEFPTKTSFRNELEASAVINCVLSIHSETNIPLTKMIVFTQYVEQKRYLVQRFSSVNATGPGGIEIREIEDFQGDERDVVILSLVRNREEAGGTFDQKMLNTAMGRTGRLVVIIGDGRVTQASKHNSWRNLMKLLIEKHAVDGYDYETGAFDGHLWQPLPVKPLSLVLKAEVATRPKEARESRFCRFSKDEVLANETQYFVGVVSGFNSWEATASMHVRHRMISGVDVLLEEQTTSGQRKDFIFDGDIVAVEIDPRLTRWRESEYTQQPTKKYAVTQPDTIPQLEIDEVVTIEEFESCLPVLLRNNSQTPLTPVGNVVAILLQPDLPPLVGTISASGREFSPVNLRFPQLIIEGVKENTPRGQYVVARLMRPANREPFYNFSGQVSQPFSLGDVLRLHSPKLPTGSRVYPQSEFSRKPHTGYSFVPASRNAYRATPIPGGIGVSVYIPFVANVFAHNPNMEREAASRGSSILQPAIKNLCSEGRLPMVDHGNKDEFYNAAFSPDGRTKRFEALHIYFVARETDEESGLDMDYIFQTTTVELVQVGVLPLNLHMDSKTESDEETHGEEAGEIITAAEILAERRSRRSGRSAAITTAVQVATELDTWADFAAALFMSRRTPFHSLLVRQDPPQFSVSNPNVTKRLERQEYWVPTRIPITRGYHYGSSFPVFARVSSPWERYGDVLTQRLLLIAASRTSERVRDLTTEEKDLAKAVRRHANWLNTIPLIYGE